ncbi:MAG: discoidin domain-containing protein, partial [Candidatus Eisenbacteria bacterium]
ARRDFATPLVLPPNYRFRFAIKGDLGPENLEFKLIDSTGANVWWMNRRDFTFPRDWQAISTRKRQIEFAWGPGGGGELARAAAIEIAITAGSGGQGTVWLDDFTLEPLPPADAPAPAPLARASSAARGAPAALALDADSLTAWRSKPGDRRPALTVDYGTPRELSALTLDWLPGAALSSYAIDFSDDGAAWRTVREVQGGDGGRDLLYLPESETRFLRLRALADAPAAGIALGALTLRDPSWAPGVNEFFRHVADAATPGLYPRAYAGQQSYWTVVGADSSPVEALFDEDARLEPWKGGPSIEPWLFTGGKLVGWADVSRSFGLEDGDLPMPRVTWDQGGLQLTTSPFALEPSTRVPLLVVRYRLLNQAGERRSGALALAMRPFQVNPPTQFLNAPGGVAPLATIARRGELVTLGDHPAFTWSRAPDAFGAATFDQGDAVAAYLRAGVTPPADSVSDASGHASAAALWKFDLLPGENLTVELTIPMSPPDPDMPPVRPVPFDLNRELTAFAWRGRQGNVGIELPLSAGEVVRTLRAQLAWARVNRDGPALQPGSRSYERSWIRDGALSSAAFLRMGQPDVARAFARWFAPYVPADGAVPCCVDRRGPDPTPEHDSHGEFIYLVAEIFRATGDRAFAEELWPAAERAANHIDALREQRRTAEWRTPENAPFFGLLPPSISHEGYSAKPMHSYWDDFFALKGLKDATFLAGALGHRAEAAHFAASRDTFASDLGRSIRAAMAVHAIDFVPGSADLGDFDATSTTIGLDPVDAETVLPPGALEATFERYWDFFRKRRDGIETWDAYTPYELRAVGAFARLGWRERAYEALSWFLRHRRPPEFRAFTEVVGRDTRQPRFIGDEPHSWVGTDYVRSVLDMLAFTRGAAGALVVAAGVPRAWAEQAPGVRVSRMPTPFGSFGYSLRVENGIATCALDGWLRVPPGGIEVAPPAGDAPYRSVRVNGRPAKLTADGRVVVRQVPAEIVFRP